MGGEEKREETGTVFGLEVMIFRERVFTQGMASQSHTEELVSLGVGLSPCLAPWLNNAFSPAPMSCTGRHSPGGAELL